MTWLLQEEMSGPELVYAAQQDEEEAFDQLYACYYNDVFRYVYARLQNWQEAEDITQEVFLRAWLNIHNFEEKGIPFIHYLFRIAHNVVIDYHRRNKQLIYVEEIDFNPVDTNTEDMINLRLDMHNLSFFLKKLPEDYEKVLVLRFLTGLSPKETAKSMHRTEVATRILQHRALMAVRDLANQEMRKNN